MSSVRRDEFAPCWMSIFGAAKCGFAVSDPGVVVAVQHKSWWGLHNNGSLEKWEFGQRPKAEEKGRVGRRGRGIPGCIPHDPCVRRDGWAPSPARREMGRGRGGENVE